MVTGAPKASDSAPPIRLLLDIGQGVGLAGASGVRPFLPPLLAGLFARADVGVDFERGPLAFLESTVFLFAVLLLAVAAYALERRRQLAGGGGDAGRHPLEIGLLVAALALGALMFAGSLTEGGTTPWPGLVAGPLCAALAFASVSGLMRRAGRRLDASAAALLPVYADALALALAGLAILVPPVSFLALVAFVVLLVRTRSSRSEKFEGLRILR